MNRYRCVVLSAWIWGREPVPDETAICKFRHRPLTTEDRASNRAKSKVRDLVEHVFGVIKRQFGYVKVRCRGLTKNAHALFAIRALVNLFAL